MSGLFKVYFRFNQTFYLGKFFAIFHRSVKNTVSFSKKPPVKNQRSREMNRREQFDIAIAGAGVAGTALAKALADRGLSVCIVDKTEKVSPNILAGELLQPGGVSILENLGMLKSLEGYGALEVKGFAIFNGEKSLLLPYSSIGKERTVGYTFHFSDFVNGLRSYLKEKNGIYFRVGTIKELWLEGNCVKGLKYSDREGREIQIESKVTVIASGRNEVLREQAGGKANIKKLGYAIGMRLQDATLPLEGYGHVILAKPAPVLAYRIARDQVRILFDIPGKIPSQKNGELREFLLREIVPQLPREISEHLTETLQRERDKKLPVMQVLFKQPVMKSRPGSFIIGDALSTRHPLTGGGMTVALNDAQLLASYLAEANLQDTAELEKLASKFYRERERMAATIDMLSEALYRIFRAEEPGLELLRQAVIRYWELGGRAISGPMSLLSGLEPNPKLLFFHYVAVAALEMSRQLFRYQKLPLRKRIKNALALGDAAYKTISPHLPRALRSTLPPLS